MISFYLFGIVFRPKLILFIRSILHGSSTNLTWILPTQLTHQTAPREGSLISVFRIKFNFSFYPNIRRFDSTQAKNLPQIKHVLYVSNLMYVFPTKFSNNNWGGNMPWFIFFGSQKISVTDFPFAYLILKVSSCMSNLQPNCKWVFYCITKIKLRHVRWIYYWFVWFT
jgi:hypothetical protein